MHLERHLENAPLRGLGRPALREGNSSSSGESFGGLTAGNYSLKHTPPVPKSGLDNLPDDLSDNRLKALPSKGLADQLSPDNPSEGGG